MKMKCICWLFHWSPYSVLLFFLFLISHIPFWIRIFRLWCQKLIACWNSSVEMIFLEVCLNYYQVWLVQLKIKIIIIIQSNLILSTLSTNWHWHWHWDIEFSFNWCLELFASPQPYQSNERSFFNHIASTLNNLFLKDIKLFKPQTYRQTTRAWRILYLIKAITDRTPHTMQFFADYFMTMGKQLVDILALLVGLPINQNGIPDNMIELT